ncbi:MAG: conjugal transfer protein TraX [Firmicutes bacterium]|nr:conjugal transfer protein TraX [Bacillota bacterium]
METLRNKLRLDATTLKIIACVLMFCDHIHQMWEPVGAPMWLTYVGRLVFPIFMFLMADSFHYTRSRKKLILRLFFASLFMTAMNKVISTLLPNEAVMLTNNAFSTFLIATLYMLFYDMIKNGIKEKNAKKIIGGALLCLVPILTAIPIILATSPLELPQPLKMTLVYISFIIPNFLTVEGGFGAVMLGVAFYIFRERRWAQALALVAMSAMSFISQGGFGHASHQWMMVSAIIPLFMYSGKKGRGMKDFFYVFYPGHIYLLYVIATLWK